MSNIPTLAFGVYWPHPCLSDVTFPNWIHLLSTCFQTMKYWRSIRILWAGKRRASIRTDRLKSGPRIWQTAQKRLGCSITATKQLLFKHLTRSWEFKAAIGCAIFGVSRIWGRFLTLSL